MITLISCALCENTFIDRRGLSSHVRREHPISWNDYKNKYPVTKDQVTEVSVIKVPEEIKAPENTYLAERMDRLENIINTFFGGYTTTGNPSGITDFPGESIEIVGEKVNYKVALDPEIFSTYNKFKAICMKRGTPWDKDFSDFLMFSVKDAMAIHGIYDTVLEIRGDKILFEMPVGDR